MRRAGGRARLHRAGVPRHVNGGGRGHGMLRRETWVSGSQCVCERPAPAVVVGAADAQAEHSCGLWVESKSTVLAGTGVLQGHAEGCR